MPLHHIEKMPIIPVLVQLLRYIVSISPSYLIDDDNQGHDNKGTSNNNNNIITAILVPVIVVIAAVIAVIVIIIYCKFPRLIFIYLYNHYSLTRFQTASKSI